MDFKNLSAASDHPTIALWKMCMSKYVVYIRNIITTKKLHLCESYNLDSVDNSCDLRH